MYPDKEFIVCALDLLSGIAEGLESTFENVASGDIFPILYACTNDTQSDVRQSALALVGDLAKNAPSKLQPHLGQFVSSAIQNLDFRYVAVCNNASWALGEIALKVRISSCLIFFIAHDCFVISSCHIYLGWRQFEAFRSRYHVENCSFT